MVVNPMVVDPIVLIEEATGIRMPRSNYNDRYRYHLAGAVSRPPDYYEYIEGVPNKIQLPSLPDQYRPGGICYANGVCVDRYGRRYKVDTNSTLKTIGKYALCAMFPGPCAAYMVGKKVYEGVEEFKQRASQGVEHVAHGIKQGISNIFHSVEEKFKEWDVFGKLGEAGKWLLIILVLIAIILLLRR